jgi:ABC-type branched-subunit amino acid transport system substrate-binding protein
VGLAVDGKCSVWYHRGVCEYLGGAVKRLGTSFAVVLVTLALVVVGMAGATTRTATDEKPAASEVGVTPTEVHIAVVADVDNPFQPGLFQGAVDAVRAAAKTINQSGGIGGRKVVVDFYDSKVNPNEARNSVIQACQNDFALVGTAALFLTTAEDEINCKNKDGQPAGIPDIGAIVTGVAQQCNPMQYAAAAFALDCATKDQSPQTFQINQGTAKWLLENVDKDLHGASVLPNDTKDAYRGGKLTAEVLDQAGVEKDQEVTRSGRDPQSAYTPIVTQMKADDSNFAFDSLAYSQFIELQKEAELQGIDMQSVTWLCGAACYDTRYLTEGGSATEGTYVPLTFLPFNETKYNKALATMVKNWGASKVNGLGLFAYSAGLAFGQVANDIVAEQGANALTRENLIEGLQKLTSFDSGGITGPVNIGEHKISPCFVLLQVQDGEFVRVWPKKKGTFDCTKSNYSTLQLDLLNS